jgi:hypothetical protein
MVARRSPEARQSHCTEILILYSPTYQLRRSLMIATSFKELRSLIDRILVEMRDCDSEQVFQIERQIRSAHAYLAQRNVTPQEALYRIGNMASMAAAQLETIAPPSADCAPTDSPKEHVGVLNLTI